MSGEALSDDVRNYFEREGKLDRLGEIFGVEVYPEPLGCGFYGCAYETDGPFVIKITSDEDEGPMWERLRQLQLSGELSEGLPKIERVIGIVPEPSSAPEPLYAALREDVAPAPKWVDGRKFSELLSDFSVAASADPPDDASLFEIASIIEEYDESARELGSLLYRLTELGIPPPDLHGGNIGMRSDPQFGEPGQLLFIDPGTKSVEEAVPERFAANVVRKMGRPKLEGVDMSRFPSPPPVRRVVAPPPRREPEEPRRVIRRIVEEYEEQEKPFEPEVPPERYAMPHHFAVNPSFQQVRAADLIVGDTVIYSEEHPEEGSLIVDISEAHPGRGMGRRGQRGPNLNIRYDDQTGSLMNKHKIVTILARGSKGVRRNERSSVSALEQSAIHWPLTEEELEALRYIGARYESGKILAGGYDEEDESISAADAIAAFIATAGDGGDIGRVPLVGGALGKKIEKLWSVAISPKYVTAAEAYGKSEGESPYDYLEMYADGELSPNARCQYSAERNMLMRVVEGGKRGDQPRRVRDAGATLERMGLISRSETRGWWLTEEGLRLRDGTNLPPLNNNPAEQEAIVWPLTEEEQEALAKWIAPRYSSGEILYQGWDPESQTISVDDARAAFIATAKDGGNVGVVPLAGGELQRKIGDLWDRAGAWDFFDAAEAYATSGGETPYDYLDMYAGGYDRNPAGLCPVGTEVQTLIFDPDKFNKTEAKRWAKDNGFKATKIDETRDSYRMRQKDPRSFKKTGFRTIQITEGVQAVVGCPKQSRS